MTIRFINKTVLHCKCIHCHYEWETLSKPKRCAGCKRLTWNGEDQRRVDPLEFVPPGSLLNGKVPQLDHKELINVLRVVRGILEQLVADYGPCTHPKDRAAIDKEDCVCRETDVLAKVNTQIELLERFAAKQKKKEPVEA